LIGGKTDNGQNKSGLNTTSKVVEAGRSREAIKMKENRYKKVYKSVFYSYFHHKLGQ
jgi:hypothetical protein